MQRMEEIPSEYNKTLKNFRLYTLYDQKDDNSYQ